MDDGTNEEMITMPVSKLAKMDDVIKAAKKVVSHHDKATLGISGDSLAIEKLRVAIDVVDPL